VKTVAYLDRGIFDARPFWSSVVLPDDILVETNRKIPLVQFTFEDGQVGVQPLCFIEEVISGLHIRSDTEKEALLWSPEEGIARIVHGHGHQQFRSARLDFRRSLAKCR
jgi:hypothetical protein